MQIKLLLDQPGQKDIVNMTFTDEISLFGTQQHYVISSL